MGRRTFFMVAIIGALIMFIGPFCWVVFYERDVFPITNAFVILSTFATAGSMEALAKNNDTVKRIIKFGGGFDYFIARYLPKIFLIIGVIYLLVEITIVIEFPPDIRLFLGLSQRDVIIVILQILLNLLYISLVFWIVRIVLRWYAPELALVRAVADAFEMVTEGSPGSWRSISLRSKAAQYIDAAATTLEGPIARKFAASAGPGGAASIRKRFLMASAALRNKVAWLATPKAETREFLARVLGDQLLITAAGDLDRLEYAEPDSAGSTTIGWFARFRATAGMPILAGGLAILVFVNKWVNWIPDPPGVAIVAQFAAIFFFVAVLSAVDPTGYKERLGSVIGTGAGLFGWSEKKG